MLLVCFTSNFSALANEPKDDSVVQENMPEDEVNKEKKITKEIPEKRNINSKHYLLEDGSYKAVFSMTPLHYEDEKGQWHDIRLELVDADHESSATLPISKEAAKELKSNDNQSQDKAKGLFRTLHTPFDVSIPKKFNQGYSIGKGEDRLTFIPVHSKITDGKVKNSKSSVSESVYGNEIYYTEAWEHVDVSLEINAMGVKESFIVKEEGAPSSFTFEVIGELKSDFTTEQFEVLPAWLVDSKGVTRDVPQELRLGEDGKMYIDIKPDYTGLSYPIIVDPSSYLKGFSGYDYTHTYEAYPNNTYSGSVGIGGQPGQTRNGFLRFNVLPVIPQSATVTSAILKVKLGSYTGDVEDTIPVRVHSAMTSWSPSTLTWNNQPLLTSNFNSGSLYVGYLNEYWDIPATEATKHIIQTQQNTGYVIKMMDTRPIYAFLNLTYREPDFIDHTTYHPILHVYYIIAPSKPTITSPNGGESVDKTHLLTWNASTDADNPQSSLSYQIQLSGDGGSTWSDIATTAAGSTTYTYDFSNNADTNQGLIRIRAYDGAYYSEWDQSDSMFIIAHNKVPNVPSGISPIGTLTSTKLDLH
jgi:hypothetical protein